MHIPHFIILLASGLFTFSDSIWGMLCSIKEMSVLLQLLVQVLHKVYHITCSTTESVSHRNIAGMEGGGVSVATGQKVGEV